MNWFQEWALTLVIFLPAVGLAIILLLPKAEETAAKTVALVTTLATLGVGVAILFDFDYDHSGRLQYIANEPWIDVIKARYHLGLDAVARQLFYDRVLADYAEHPRTIVLSTHLIDEVSDLIEHVVLIDKGRILIDEDAEALRTHAVTVTGPVASVESFVAGRTVLHREQLGGFLRVTVTGTPDRPSVGGLEFEPVSLQQLVVRTTQINGQPVGAGTGNGGNR